MQTHFHKLLEAAIREEIDKEGRGLVRGSALDYPKYQYMVGYIAGLDACLNIADDLAREPNE